MRTTENTEEWIGHLIIKWNECGYKEKYKGLKEQFIICINENDMMTEVINDLFATKMINEIPSEQVLS